ncbi:hypothetical protein D6T64_11890 [Cryobacterium melibiosiphilum]|uniref:Uncharacterized protein n=1 Tax=Cryobacterium melibiosiphilum TaxID=995039 RepID=A0A3A5MRS6_9MICO|nr:hypothetical protein [Cryobacterium melibiosiphilum]RJT88084.1 hypothetical protein D6T64_11890 [Cryobacterium melibiosiphilum]
MSKITNTLNRIARALGEDPLMNRAYNRAESAELVRAAEFQIDKHWGTDMHDAISMWFSDRLAELELA